MDTISKGEMRKPDAEEWQNKPNDEFTVIDYADGVLNGTHFFPQERDPENVTRYFKETMSKLWITTSIDLPV